MTILGIDPGIASMGFGVVSYDGQRCRMLDYGVLSTKPDMPMPQRLVALFEGLTDIQKRHQPDDIALEELFFGANVSTAIVVGEARGVALTAAALHTRNIYEYTPPQIKQAITGYGRADKGQVQRMVMALLQLKELPRPDDAADGLAVAICHAHSLRSRDRFIVK